MTDIDRLLGTLEGRLIGLDGRMLRVEKRLEQTATKRDLEDALDQARKDERITLTDMRLEDMSAREGELRAELQRLRAARSSIRPRRQPVSNSVVMWVLGAIGALATGLAAWFGSGR